MGKKKTPFHFIFILTLDTFILNSEIYFYFVLSSLITALISFEPTQNIRADLDFRRESTGWVWINCVVSHK